MADNPVDLRDVTNDELAAVMDPSATVRDAFENFKGRDKCRSINVFSEDATGCCKRIKAASVKGTLDTATEWTCTVCGMAWKPREAGGMRFWEAHPLIEVIPRWGRLRGL